jgi:hypothetical protein
VSSSQPVPGFSSFPRGGLFQEKNMELDKFEQLLVVKTAKQESLTMKNDNEIDDNEERKLNEEIGLLRWLVDLWKQARTL